MHVHSKNQEASNLQNLVFEVWRGGECRALSPDGICMRLCALVGHAEFAHGVVNSLCVCVNNFSSALRARLHDLIFTTQNKFRDGALGANAALAKEYYTTLWCVRRALDAFAKKQHTRLFLSLSNYEKETARSPTTHELSCVRACEKIQRFSYHDTFGNSWRGYLTKWLLHQTKRPPKLSSLLPWSSFFARAKQIYGRVTFIFSN